MDGYDAVLSRMDTKKLIYIYIVFLKMIFAYLFVF